MELMSSAFLCVLVALLPQTLVNARNKNTFMMESMSSNSSMNRQKSALRKPLLLNINAPPLVNNASELQAVFNDNACKLCNKCMDNAIRAYNLHINKLNNRPSAEELREDVFANEVENHSARNQVKARTKRNIQPTPETILDAPKKAKNKKNRLNKTVAITKYDVDGKVYALKVKETQLATEKQNDDKPDGTCQVYSVKKSFPCGSSEGEGLILAAKRKANKKKSKREQDKKVVSTPNSQTTVTVIPTHTSFKKREVDNSQVPENFMPSIEDFF